MQSENLPFAHVTRNIFLVFLILCFPVVSFCFPAPAFSDTSSSNLRGLPFIKNYNPAQYLHLTSYVEHPAILQDNSGRILVGSRGGILIYNGNSWQLAETPGRSMVWALAKDSTGRVYVGTSGDLGYLAPDSIGKTSFVSLLAYLPQEHRSVGDVWQTLVTPEGVYFKSNQLLMRWHNKKFSVWKSEKTYGNMHWLAGKLYMQVPEGMVVLKNDRFESFSTDKILTQNWVKFMLPLNSGRWLVGVYPEGLFYFDGQQTTPVSRPVASYLKENGLFSGSLLPDSTIAVTTLNGGMVIIDQQANIQRLINKESGLVSNTVYLATADQEGGLWISHEKGISRVQAHTPFSYFNENNGLLRQPTVMCEHQGNLYAGTTDGLFVLEAQQGIYPSAVFRQVGKSAYSISDLKSAGNSLLIASKDGFIEWKNGKFTPLPIASAFWESYSQVIARSITDSTLFYVASRQLHIFRKQQEEWQKLGILDGLPENITQILQPPSGELWLLSEPGVARVRFPGGRPANLSQSLLNKPTVEHFGKKQGLPEGITRLYLAGKDILAQAGDTDPKLYRFQQTSHTFELVANYGLQFGLMEEQVHPAMAQSNGQHLWLWAKHTADKVWQLKQATKGPDGKYEVKQYRMSGTTHPLKHFFYEQPGKAVWFTSTDGLIQLNWPAAKETVYTFKTILEQIQVGTDRVLYPQEQADISLPYQDNSLRFEFAAPSYNGTGENKFQYYLEGFDKGWSAWTNESFKDYTRIPEGKYTFHVRAKNGQEQHGTEASYTFTIRPPVYRTSLMYAFYLLLAGGGIYGLIRWRSARLEAEKAQLEQIIAQRTGEIAEKNEQLHRQTRQLQELDGAKSRFFANISHEFRTPLTLILNGLLDKLAIVHNNPVEEQVSVSTSELQVMSRNAKRLLGLINQLLDLSKIESGSMQINLQNGNLTQLLQVVHGSFASLAEHRHIRFRLQLPEQPLLCQYDEDKLEKILYNLLSNAFKFTPEGGEIVVSTQVTEHTPDNHPHLQIHVQDSGPGIAADQLAKIFDRFYQGKQYYTDSQGTGIGLALSKELAELHGGRIWAESTPGKGARFVVLLPLIPNTSHPLETSHEPANEYDLTGQYTQEELSAEQRPLAAQTVLSGQEELPVVLIVEDNEDLRAYIRRHLQGKYRVEECEHGLQGLAIAQEIIPDLIISDWMMPHLNGLELCTHLKNDVRTSHVPVILLTALATEDAKLKGLETGADDYLTKPFSTAELDKRVANLIENRRKLREHFSREIRLEPTRQVVASAEEKFLQKVMQAVEERMGDAEFSVDELSRELGLSRVHLHRKLKALTGESASDFIRMMRLKRAAQLLEARAGNIAEIAYQVGFNTLSYFSKCFKEQFGVLPNEYIRKGTVINE